MQVTFELPDELATRIQDAGVQLSAIIEAGIRARDWPGSSLIANEVIDFLASGPDARRIINFHPSESVLSRMRDLLLDEKEGHLDARGKAELDELELFDYFVSLLKARACEFANKA